MTDYLSKLSGLIFYAFLDIRISSVEGRQGIRDTERSKKISRNISELYRGLAIDMRDQMQNDWEGVFVRCVERANSTQMGKYVETKLKKIENENWPKPVRSTKNTMNRYIIYSLLDKAFDDIYKAAGNDDLDLVFAISDTFHNTPGKLPRIDGGLEGEFQKVMAFINARGKDSGLEQWLSSSIENFKREYETARQGK